MRAHREHSRATKRKKRTPMKTPASIRTHLESATNGPVTSWWAPRSGSGGAGGLGDRCAPVESAVAVDTEVDAGAGLVERVAWSRTDRS